MSRASTPDPAEIAELRQRVAWLEWQLWQGRTYPTDDPGWTAPTRTTNRVPVDASVRRFAVALALRWAGVIAAPLGWLSLPPGDLRLAAVALAGGILFVLGVAGSWRRRGFAGGLWRTLAAALLVSLAAELGLRLGSTHPWQGMWAVWAAAMAAMALDAFASTRRRP